MSRSHLRVLSVALLICGLIIIGSCTKDDIPVTPGGPFLFTNVRIAKQLTPVPETPLRKVQNYTVRFVVDYTLAPKDEAQKANRGIYADVYCSDSSGAFLSILATTPAASGLTASSGAVAESLTFSVPVRALTVTLEAYIDTIPTAGFVLTLDDKSWPVQ